jgi:glycosyltransferase involved in cell wall biosynthesis
MIPELTIGLPFYNDKKTLEQALKSVLVQTYQNWELVLIDDGSSDGSLEIARQLKDPRIRLISDGENKGLIARLNQVVQVATGKYIARMDADDLMDKTRLEKQMNYLRNHPDIDLVDTGVYSIDQDGIPVGKRGLQDIATNPKEILRHAMLIHASVVGKRSWFLSNPYNNEFTRAEDYELWCRTFRHSAFARIKEPLYIVREGKVNVKNYVRSMKTLRHVFRVHGPATFSFVELQVELLKSRLKATIYQGFSLFNKQDILSKKRNVPLTDQERNYLLDMMKQINEVTLN